MVSKVINLAYSSVTLILITLRPALKLKITKEIRILYCWSHFRSVTNGIWVVQAWLGGVTVDSIQKGSGPIDYVMFDVFPNLKYSHRHAKVHTDTRTHQDTYNWLHVQSQKACAHTCTQHTHSRMGRHAYLHLHNTHTHCASHTWACTHTYTHTYSNTRTPTRTHTYQHLFELAVDLVFGHAVNEELYVGIARPVVAEFLHPRGTEARPVRPSRLLIPTTERIELFQLQREETKFYFTCKVYLPYFP